MASINNILRFSNEKAAQRERDLEALRRAKEKERELAEKLRSYKIDSKTVVVSTPARAKELIEELKTDKQPTLRGGALGKIKE